MDRDLFLDRASAVLIVGETLPCVGCLRLGGVQTGVELLLALGLVGQPALRVLRGRVQPLERDQAFDVGVHVKKKAPPKRGLAVRAQARRSCGRHSICQSICDQQSALCKPGNAVWWAHQDSNLEQAGYEPAALTVELWARPTVYSLQRAVASRSC